VADDHGECVLNVRRTLFLTELTPVGPGPSLSAPGFSVSAVSVVRLSAVATCPYRSRTARRTRVRGGLFVSFTANGRDPYPTFADVCHNVTWTSSPLPPIKRRSASILHDRVRRGDRRCSTVALTSNSRWSPAAQPFRGCWPRRRNVFFVRVGVELSHTTWRTIGYKHGRQS